MPRRFSVIIVHRNGAQMLLDALTALQRACDPVRDEVFVVDNGSSDGSPDRVASAFPDVRLIRNDCNNGFARANNQAIALASGTFLLLLNSDAQIAADGLDKLERHFGNHPDVGLIGASLRGPAGERQNSGHPFPTFWRELGLVFKRRTNVPDPSEPLTEVDWVVGACVAARGTAVRDAGALDRDFFFYYEDTEWSLRMRRHGWRVLVANDVPVIHMRGSSTRGLRKEALVEELRSRLMYYRKAFRPVAATILSLHRFIRLVPKGLFWGTMVLLTLGLVSRLRRRSIRYLHPLVWLLAGMPENWGLPDKCPPATPNQT